MADPDRLAQLIANLIENALRYAAHEVRVTVLASAAAEPELWVADDGPGIAPEDLAGCSTGCSWPGPGPTGRSARGWAWPSWPSWCRPWAARCGPSRPSAGRGDPDGRDPAAALPRGSHEGERRETAAEDRGRVHTDDPSSTVA